MRDSGGWLVIGCRSLTAYYDGSSSGTWEREGRSAQAPKPTLGSVAVAIEHGSQCERAAKGEHGLIRVAWAGQSDSEQLTARGSKAKKALGESYEAGPIGHCGDEYLIYRFFGRRESQVNEALASLQCSVGWTAHAPSVSGDGGAGSSRGGACG